MNHLQTLHREFNITDTTRTEFDMFFEICPFTDEASPLSATLVRPDVCLNLGECNTVQIALVHKRLNHSDELVLANAISPSDSERALINA